MLLFVEEYINSLSNENIYAITFVSVFDFGIILCLATTLGISFDSTEKKNTFINIINFQIISCFIVDHIF